MRSWLSVCFYGRKVQERKPIYRLLHHYNSLSNKMDKSLLAVRNINHKYIVVGKEVMVFAEVIEKSRII